MKMTNATALSTAIDTLSTLDNMGEVVERLTAIRATYEKRASRPSAPSKAKVENDILREGILSVLTETPSTIEEICASCVDCASLSTHKMAGLLSSLCRDGAVERTKVKGKTYYHIPLAE